MKKTGFTLIELLAVIVILGIILSIAVVSVTGVIKNSKTDAKELIKKELEKGAKNWVLDHINLIICSESAPDEYVLYADELVNQDYLSPIKNPSNTSEFCNNTLQEEDSTITVTCTSTLISGTTDEYNYKYAYAVELKCPTP